MSPTRFLCAKVLAQQGHAPHHKHKHKHKHTHQQNPMQTHTQHTTHYTTHTPPTPYRCSKRKHTNTNTNTYTYTYTHPSIRTRHLLSSRHARPPRPHITRCDSTRLASFIVLRSSLFVLRSRSNSAHRSASHHSVSLSIPPTPQLLLNSSPTIESNRRRTPRRDKRLASKPAKTSTNTHKTEKRKPKACAAKQNTAQREGATQRNATQCSAPRRLWR